MSTECKICNRWFGDNQELTVHVRRDHKLTVHSYYDAYLRKPDEGKCKICGAQTTFNGCGKGYATYCSVSCALKDPEGRPDKETEITCKICGHIVKEKNQQAAKRAFIAHMRNTHGIYDNRIYYDRFVKQDGEGKCPVCGEETKFISVFAGYEQYCSTKCAGVAANRDKNSSNSRKHFAAIAKEKIKELANKVVEKYRSFLHDEKKTGWSDIRENGLIRENVNDERVVETVDGGMAVVKTEISMSTARPEWMGTQHRYVPKMENCVHDTYTDEIVDSDDTINTTEWC